jgi:hypothetical protein
MTRSLSGRFSATARGAFRAAGRAAVYPLILFPLAWMVCKAAARHAWVRARSGTRRNGRGEETR